MIEDNDKSVDYKKISSAVSSAIVDRFSNKGRLKAVTDGIRIDGKVCLVTGANSGLGKAVAVELAKRGGHILMACRGGHPQAGEDVRKASGSGKVEMLKVDLADLDAIHALCDALEERRDSVDITVLNAGLMPLNARPSKQGYELMFAVHFLANRMLLDRLLGNGVIQPSSEPGETPRIVFVASETHRSAGPIDFEQFGAFTDYGLKDGLKYYGLSKLHSCTFARELSRRLNIGADVRAAVHALCPGPINSNIAREAPASLRPVLAPLMRLLFASPAKAAQPVIHLCCSDAMGRRTGAYLHMMREKEPSALARDGEAGARLWEASAALLAKHPPPATGAAVVNDSGQGPAPAPAEDQEAPCSTR